MSFKKAVFWDRDGIINNIKVKNGKSLSPRKFSEFKVFPFIKKLFIEIQNLGFLNIVFTNQPDISRSLMDPRELDLMHDYLMKNFEIAKIYYCPHSNEDKCLCRKPLPGMLNIALEEFSLNKEECLVVGDRITDIISGSRASIHNLYLLKRSYSYKCYNGENIPKHKTVSSIQQIPEIIRKNL